MYFLLDFPVLTGSIYPMFSLLYYLIMSYSDVCLSVYLTLVLFALVERNTINWFCVFSEVNHLLSFGFMFAILVKSVLCLSGLQSQNFTCFKCSYSATDITQGFDCLNGTSNLAKIYHSLNCDRYCVTHERWNRSKGFWYLLFPKTFIINDK